MRQRDHGVTVGTELRLREPAKELCRRPEPRIGQQRDAKEPAVHEVGREDYFPQHRKRERQTDQQAARRSATQLGGSGVRSASATASTQ